MTVSHLGCAVVAVNEEMEVKYATICTGSAGCGGRGDHQFLERLAELAARDLPRSVTVEHLRNPKSGSGRCTGGSVCLVRRQDLKQSGELVGEIAAVGVVLH